MIAINYYLKAEENLNLICLECKFYATNNCIKSKYNIGFTLNAIKVSNPS